MARDVVLLFINFNRIHHNSLVLARSTIPGGTSTFRGIVRVGVFPFTDARSANILRAVFAISRVLIDTDVSAGVTSADRGVSLKETTDISYRIAFLLQTINCAHSIFLVGT